MKNREWYEDSIQSILCGCLPNMAPANIRPSYQTTKLTNPMGLNHMDVFDPMKDGIRAATNKDNLIYFWLHFDPLDMLSTEIGDTISSVIPFKLTVTCYGKDSFTNAIRIKAFLRTPDILNQMLNMQAITNGEPVLTSFPEELNGEWWKRTDVDVTWDVLIDDFADGEEAAQGSLGEGKGYSKATGGEIVVEDVSNGTNE